MSIAGGKRAGWSSIYQSDRPRDILGLTEAQEATLKQFFGITGKDQDGEENQIFTCKYEGTSEPTLTNYATTPVGTIIIAPFLVHSKIYVHKTQSASPVVGDWEVFESEAIEPSQLPDGLFYVSNKIFKTSDDKLFTVLS